MKALQGLNAEVIAVPPFSLDHLETGHAVHFRCRHPEAMGMRVDVMSRMRGVSDFQTLERLQDRAYWQPLKQELERLRRRHKNA